MDLKLNSSGDLDITNGALSWVTGLEAKRQKLEMGLRTWLGESVYDRSGGIPYKEIVFARGTSDAAVVFIFENKITQLLGVGSVVLELEVVRDASTREATVTGRAKVAEGEFDFEVTA